MAATPSSPSRTKFGSSGGRGSVTSIGAMSQKGLMADGLTIDLRMLNWEKEHWDGVQLNVKNAFQVVSNNTSRLQTWTQDMQDTMKQVEGDSILQRGTLDDLIDEVEETRSNLSDLTKKFTALSTSTRQELDSNHASTKVLLEVFSSFFTHFVHAMRNQDFSKATSPARPKAQQQSSTSERDVLNHLDDLSSKLSTEFTHLDEAFLGWDKWRASKDEKEQYLCRRLDEHQRVSDAAQERMLQWREMLKENTQTVDALNNSLAETQNDIRSIQSVQIVQEHLDDVLGKKGDEILEVFNNAEERFSDFRANLSKSMAEVETKLKVSQEAMSQQVSELGETVRNSLESGLNPVHAFLNSIHVKTNTMRADVDQLQKQVPQLQTGIEDATGESRQFEKDGIERHRQLSVRLDELTMQSSENIEKAGRERADIATANRQLRQEVGEHLEKVHQSLTINAEAVEALRQTELPRVCREFLALEEKVAKWVRTDPMPSKISEARLYSLEARLAQEMEARLLFEEGARKSGLSPAHSSLAGSPYGRSPGSVNSFGNSASGIMLPALPAQAAGQALLGRLAFSARDHESSRASHHSMQHSHSAREVQQSSLVDAALSKTSRRNSRSTKGMSQSARQEKSARTSQQKETHAMQQDSGALDDRLEIVWSPIERRDSCT